MATERATARRRAAGQSTVEFLLTAWVPIFFLLLAGQLYRDLRLQTDARMDARNALLERAGREQRLSGEWIELKPRDVDDDQVFLPLASLFPGGVHVPSGPTYWVYRGTEAEE